MRVTWYTAMSMDGRIADSRQSLDFLQTIRGEPEDGGGDFEDLLRSVNAALVGANTLRWLLRGGHGWPHDGLPTWLVSHDPGLAEQVGSTRAPFHRVEGPLQPVLEQMAAAGVGRVWLCGGGDVAAQVLALDGLDEVVATVAPTALGRGPALFDGEVPMRRFRLLDARPLGGDAVRLHWERDREARHS